MKKLNILLFSSLLLGSSTMVQAARTDEGTTPEETLTASTKANFEVTAGKLNLDKAPDYNFGSYDIMSIMKMAAGTDGIKLDQQATDDNTITVSDYRGFGNEWSLTAKMTTFKDADGNELTGSIIVPNANESATINTTDDSEIWNSKSADTQGLSTKDADQSKGATLMLDDVKTLKAGNYTATINWTLNDTTTKATQG